MTDASRPKLYAFWRSSATYRVRVALAFKGIEAEEIPIDLDAGEQFAPGFLAVNPEGAVPALIEPGQRPLTQSIAILEYIEERHPEPALMPAEAHGRARVRSLAALMVSDTHPLVVPRVREYLTGRAGFDQAAWRAWQIHWFTRGLQAMEKRLSGDPATGDFCHGDRPTIADICLASVGAVARVFKVEVPEIPTVTRIIDRCEALDAFVRAHPARQQGAPK